MKMKRPFMCLLSVGLLFAGGCGTGQAAEENIELLDPVGFVTEQETVAYRNITSAETFSTTVSPYIEEYAFSKAVNGFYYNVFPGTEVKKGDVLVSTDTSATENRIEKIESLLSEELEKADELEAAYNADNDPETYESYLKQKQLYELDSTFYAKELEELKAELEKSFIRSEIDGCVASIFLNGSSVKAGAAVISVADDSRKFLRTDYIRLQAVNAASHVYALIGGEKYEVRFEHADAEKSFTYFSLIDPENSVDIGASALLVMIKESASHVLSIAQSEIREDASGTYIYVMNGGSSEKRYIVTGASDGIYTEIVSGAKEGDRISNSVAAEDNGKHGTVVTVDSVKSFSKNGYFSYPESAAQYASIANGTVYFKGFTVDQYDIVNVGDTIAKIEVVCDEIELERLRLRLKRLTEREASPAEVEKLTKQITAIEKDRACVEIVSEFSGVVADLADIKEGDIVKYGAVLFTVADPANCYVAVDAGNNLPYGTEVLLSLSGGNSGGEARGKVVTLGELADATTLKNDYTLIQLSADTVAQAMQAVSMFGRRLRINVKAEITAFKDITAVPRSAVTIYDGCYYANVVYEDGSVHTVTFVSCGRDSDYFYCVSGLSEGDVVCLK